MIDPDAVTTLIGLGRVHVTAGRPARAVEVLEARGHRRANQAAGHRRLPTRWFALAGPPRERNGLRSPTSFTHAPLKRNVVCEASRSSRCRPRSATASVTSTGRSISGGRSSDCSREVRRVSSGSRRRWLPRSHGEAVTELSDRDFTGRRRRRPSTTGRGARHARPHRRECSRADGRRPATAGGIAPARR